MIVEVYLMSWLNAFNTDGDFPTKDDMYHFYELQGTLGMALVFVFFGFVGYIVDKLSIRATLPLALLVRIGVFYMIYTINNPE